MVQIVARNGNVAKRAVARTAARWFVKHGMPITRDIKVNIVFSGSLMEEEDSMGAAYWNGRTCYHSKSFTIEIADEIKSLEEIIETVMHEMIHIHQMSSRIYRYGATKLVWKGMDYSGVDYEKQPWEEQAYELEETLTLQFMRWMRENPLETV
jgi:hypothetical protein